MIHIIIVEDNILFNNTIKEEVTRILFSKDLEYRIFQFYDFDEEFDQVMKSEIPLKIYILDIETPSACGIDITRKIRTTDMESIIIFLTNYDEFGSLLLKDEIMFLSFILKNQFKVRLPNAIEKALQIIYSKKILKFWDQKIKYTIPMNDILYVTTNTVKQKTVLVTSYSVFEINKTLIEMEKILDENFVKSHRSCIVNTKRIVSVNKNLHIITFDNGDRTGLMNDQFKKNYLKDD